MPTTLDVHLQFALNCIIQKRFSAGFIKAFLARDAFVRTSHRAIAVMFVRLSEAGVHCDHTMHFSVDLGLWLDSPMFWAP